MRLEVTCQDRIGLTRELLDLLVLRNIDLKGIEISPARRIYLNFTQIDFNTFRLLMAEIRRISGVIDVRTVAFMPSEKEHRAMWTLLESVPEPIFSIDMKGNIELANPASLSLFDLDKEKVDQKNIANLISNYNFSRWLESEHHQPNTTQLSIKGRDYMMDIIPMQLTDENQVVRCVGAVIILRSAVSHLSTQVESLRKKLTVNDDTAFGQLIAVSPKMVHVVEQARKMAMLDAPLLLIGETGTGKDEFAKACHLRSARGNQPFLGLNCASMPDDVVESELFGYAAGAYPNAVEGKKGFFEQANGGTVLLDEIGEMSPQMQIKLLRFLNDGTFRRVGEDNEVNVDVRIICATQKNLLELVQQGEFREDLYYRLNVLTITLPPLRERQADIMPLTDYFVTRFAKEQGLAKPKYSHDLEQFLSGYHWPGNVRQLRNAIYHALTQSEGNKLCPQDIQLPGLDADMAFNEDMLEGSLDEISKRFERSILTRLYRHYPSTRKLAKRLGVSHTAIANKLREYGLSGKKHTPEQADDDE
ncbi:putative two-component response regulator [Xenorhabdus mauleonii]|uniref:HTH-type transcriptional regulatory protein TyrR n=1 Tax=Xenorhabdus mauleonii TaxID=351675 RepID=A0A1I3NLD5_9GAMM|nr:transcriptional regulator TyrR [Xenorhabdus mauleonii]PHM45649.1 putative two-component response regulator [Xenorhabdus mauleonii]SFJ09770.1 transcriptional regulator of aroF, aroG, tyrA and aromatic amino acid transport [Xenorhabdus mauleonii]